MRELAARIGWDLPGAPDLQSLAIALVLLVASIAIGWLAGSRLGPRIAAFWERKATVHGGGLAPRMCAMLRYLVIWAMCGSGLALAEWPPLAGLVLGLGAGIGAALLVRSLARGLQLPGWGAWLLALVLFVAILADAVGGLDAITSTLDRTGFTIGRRRLSLLTLIQIVVALLALYAAVRFANRLSGQLIRRTRSMDPTQQLLAQKLVAIAILALAFFIGIDLAGIDLTALAVFSGALGLAVGFGLQKTLGNLIAGIILLMDRSIKPGDVISVGESFGSVNKIGVRAVSIVTRDGKEYLIPNEILMTEEVVNWSYSTRNVRVSIPIGVAYDCDVKRAQDLMREAAAASTRVLDSPKPVVWMTEFGENAVEHEIRIWISDPEAGLGSVRSDILNRLWELFAENGIRVPFPQRDLRIREWPAPPRGSVPD